MNIHMCYSKNISLANQPFNFGLLLLRYICLFPNFVFSGVLGESPLPKYVYRP